MSNVNQSRDGKVLVFVDRVDTALINVSSLFLLVGFILGTIDIFVRGGIATTPWFTWSWAIIQAASIDGLFFGIWGKVALSPWSKKSRKYDVTMVAAGLLLAFVAAQVNNILNYQQLNRVPDSVAAMAALGINQALFTSVRGYLIVGVAILVQVVYRRSLHQGEENSPEEKSVDPQYPTVVTPVPQLIPLAASSMPIVEKEEETEEVENTPVYTKTQESILLAIDKFTRENKKFTNVELSTETGIPLGTVKKYAPQVKRDYYSGVTYAN